MRYQAFVALLAASGVSAYFGPSPLAFSRGTIFLSRGKQPNTTMYGVLSRSDILRASKQRRHGHGSLIPTLGEVIEEALTRQEQIRMHVEAEKENSVAALAAENGIDAMEAEKEHRRHAAVKERLARLDETAKHLIDLRKRLKAKSSSKKNFGGQELGVRTELTEMGFERLMKGSTSNWLSKRGDRKEFGRPNDFAGLVFQSPNGVPILIGKMGAHADETLRRVAQGSDLWFQVEGYEGSRALLRTSLCRGYRDSKSCVQMAADLAAYYSISRWEDTVDVMYTDSKHVAKRGSKTGQLRKRKTFGSIVARPSQVEDIAEGKEP